MDGNSITHIIIIIIIIIIIGIQPLGQSGQRPEFSHATGMTLVRCILGKFLGVACHCFSPLFFLDVPTFHHQVPPYIGQIKFTHKTAMEQAQRNKLLDRITGI